MSSFHVLQQTEDMNGSSIIVIVYNIDIYSVYYNYNTTTTHIFCLLQHVKQVDNKYQTTSTIFTVNYILNIYLSDLTQFAITTNPVVIYYH